MHLPIAPVEERRLFAIGLALSSYALFTVTDSAAKWLALAGIPPAESVFLRYGVHLALIAGLFLPRYGRAVFASKSLSTQLLRALALLGATLFNFIAVRYVPLTITGALAFSMPLLVCALSAPLLGERIDGRRWISILVGFSGVLVIVRPWSADFHWAVLLSWLAVLCTSFYFILTRKLAGRDSPVTMQFYVGLVGTVVMAPFALSHWVWPSEPATWIAFFAVGLAGLLGHQISILAHRLAPASTLAPFAYVQIFYMTLSSWLIFAEPPDVWLFVGAPAVVASGLYIWIRERQLAKRLPAPISVQEVER